jgi:Tfp pilus assembly protein PilF
VWSQKGPEHIGYYYRPLFSVWLLLTHSIGGLAAWFWHLSSVILHGLVTWVFFRLSLATLRNLEAASFASLLFAVHPIHIETVCWISASNELLYSLFFLGSIFMFTRFLNANPLQPVGLWPSVLLWGAALFTKETAVALLPVFPLWAFLKKNNATPPRQARILQALRTCVPFVATAFFYLLVRSLVLHRVGTEIGQHTWRQVLFTGVDLFQFYINKLFLPLHLSPFYTNPVLTEQSLKIWITISLTVGVVALVSRVAIRYEPLVGLALSLILLPLVPVLVGIRIFRDGDLAHDRYLYLPSVGLCLLAGLLFKRIWAASTSARWVAASTGVILMTVLVGLNLSQQAYYRDDEAFYKRGLEVGPTNSLVMAFLGDHYLGQGKNDLALEQFRHAHDISPDNPEVLYRLARGLFETKNYAEAEPYLIQISRDPNLPASRRAVLALSLGQTQMRLGELSSAQSTLRELEVRNDTLRGVHQSLGALYELEGKLFDASREYEREFQISGDLKAHRRAIELNRFR